MGPRLGWSARRVGSDGPISSSDSEGSGDRPRGGAAVDRERGGEWEEGGEEGRGGREEPVEREGPAKDHLLRRVRR